MKYVPDAPYTQVTAGPDDTLPGEPKAYFLRAGEGPRHELFGQVAFQVLTGAESGGALGMTVTEGPRSPGAPAHAHPQTHEAVFVLDGRLRVRADGEEQMLTRGDFFSVPPGVEHSYVLEGHLTRFITIYGPAGPERLHELAGVASEQRIFPQHATPVDEDRLAAAAAELGIVWAN